MIRKAINCDICGVEKVESTSYWFVADEQRGELRLRGWESAKNTRKNLKHLCGQKCVQRLMDNFTAAIKAGQQAAVKSVKEAVVEVGAPAAAAAIDRAAALDRAVALDRAAAASVDRDDMPILERMGYDRETVALIEAESWAGPVRPKEESWGAESKEKGFVHAARVKPLAVRPFQRMA